MPYDNQPGSEQPLYEHLQRSLRYTLDRLGPHNLPLIGRADWNDCLNLNCFSDTPGQSFQTTTNKDGKVAESVFIAGLFVLAAKEMIDLADPPGQPGRGRRLPRRQSRIWKPRSGRPAGTAPGSGAPTMISAARSARRNARKARSSSSRRASASWPDWGWRTAKPRRRWHRSTSAWRPRTASSCSSRLITHYYLHLGEISSYPPGYKENAGIFCHTNPWIMIAETMVGHGDQAHDYYLRINPSAREEISELHRCEPYVYAQMIAGRDAPTHGEAKNSWLTGTAAWNYVAITQWILGIRAELDGLRIQPVIPGTWEGFNATRQFRGVTYQIKVRREGPGNTVRLMVDGQPVEGTLVPLPADGKKEVKVEAVIG